MTTFVSIPGAGGAAWYWHRVLPLLEQGGHEAIAVDLPGDDEHAGLRTYADLVLRRGLVHLANLFGLELVELSQVDHHRVAFFGDDVGVAFAPGDAVVHVSVTSVYGLHPDFVGADDGDV